MQKWFTSVGVGASLLVLTGAAYADGYSDPRGYERAFSWTGFYIGVQGGAGRGTSDSNIDSLQTCVGAVCGPVVPITPQGLLRDSTSMNGFHGGGTIGYNLQTGPVVLGVEADVSGSDIFGRSNCTDSFGLLGGRAGCRTELSSFGTVTGRLGLASGRTLVYGKAGLAWGNFDRDVIIGAIGAPGVTLANGSASETRTGFTVGAGVEHAVWGGWTAKLEYDFMDFGTDSETVRLTLPAAPGVSFNARTAD